MRKKLILFDWGNIVESHITGYTCYDAFNDLFKACGYIGNDNVFTSLGKYRIGSIPTVDNFEEAYNQIAKDYNFKTTYVEFIKLYKEIFDKIDYYTDVADYEKSLRDKCYIGILSNLTVFDKERLDKQVDLSKYDYVFLSFEMNCSKPNREIYEKVIDILGVVAAGGGACPDRSRSDPSRQQRRPDSHHGRSRDGNWCQATSHPGHLGGREHLPRD